MFFLGVFSFSVKKFKLFCLSASFLNEKKEALEKTSIRNFSKIRKFIQFLDQMKTINQEVAETGHSELSISVFLNLVSLFLKRCKLIFLKILKSFLEFDWSDLKISMDDIWPFIRKLHGSTINLIFPLNEWGFPLCN